MCVNICINTHIYARIHAYTHLLFCILYIDIDSFKAFYITLGSLLRPPSGNTGNKRS